MLQEQVIRLEPVRFSHHDMILDPVDRIADTPLGVSSLEVFRGLSLPTKIRKT